MRQLEIVIRIRDMMEILSEFKSICPNFGKSAFKRNHIDIYFHTDSPQDLVLRKFEDNTGELIVFDEKYFNGIIERRYELMGLPLNMAEEFLNIFSQANGQMRTISVERWIYLHFLNTFSVMIDKIDGLGDFAIIQAFLKTEDESKMTMTSLALRLLDILNDLSVSQDDIVRRPFRILMEEVNI